MWLGSELISRTFTDKPTLRPKHINQGFLEFNKFQDNKTGT